MKRPMTFLVSKNSYDNVKYLFAITVIFCGLITVKEARSFLTPNGSTALLMYLLLISLAKHLNFVKSQ